MNILVVEMNMNLKFQTLHRMFKGIANFKEGVEWSFLVCYPSERIYRATHFTVNKISLENLSYNFLQLKFEISCGEGACILQDGVWGLSLSAMCRRSLKTAESRLFQMLISL